MHITLLKCKLHRAAVTDAEPEYDGSCAIDSLLLSKAGIYEHEQIQVYNIDNGERFTTYAIRAQEHSGIISINGAAAHKAKPGDRIIICAYAIFEKSEVNSFRPTLIYLDQHNQIIRTRDHIPVQAV